MTHQVGQSRSCIAAHMERSGPEQFVVLGKELGGLENKLGRIGRFSPVEVDRGN